MYWSLRGFTRNLPRRAGHASENVATRYTSDAQPNANRGAWSAAGELVGVVACEAFSRARDMEINPVETFGSPKRRCKSRSAPVRRPSATTAPLLQQALHLLRWRVRAES